MTDREAFIQAIIANPKDELVRLVFADWLDEHEEPWRAEFIRVQCNKRKHSLNRHERKLLALHGNEWIGESLNVIKKTERIGDWRTRWKWRRGFVAEVHCPLATWIGATCTECQWGVDEVDTGGNIYQYPCSRCNGTGRVNAHGPRLVREHPIEVVRATDREPLEVHRSSLELPIVYTWMTLPNDQYLDIGFHLPQQIHDLLPPSVYNQKTYRKSFRTREAAQDALSDALIAWAKQQPVEAK